MELLLKMKYDMDLNAKLTMKALKELKQGTISDISAKTGFSRDTTLRHLLLMRAKYRTFGHIKIYEDL